MPRCRGKAKTTGKRCKRTVKDGYWCDDHPPEDAFEEMDESGRMTQAAFARLIERSDERVRQYRKQGILELEDDGKLDVAKSIEALILHGDVDRGSLPFDLYEKHVGPIEAGADEGSDEKSLKHQKLVADVNLRVQQARLAKIKADEHDGLLVDAEEIERERFEIARTTRDRLMILPDRVAAQLVAMESEREIAVFLQEEIRQALSSLCDDLREEFAAA